MREGGVAAVRWTSPGGGSWSDGRCWDAGRAPLPDERARFDRPVAGAVTIDGRVTAGRVEVDLGDPAAAVTLNGPGALVLTGADRFLGKPVSLQVARGTLRLAAPLRVEVAAPRFGAHAGGTLVIATPHVRAAAPDLKLMVSQTGVLALRAERWSPGFDLDAATSRTLGLGPHVIDFGGRRDAGPRLLAFRRFKEHDGDELLIRGFRPGDQLRFDEDPRESTDPGKELRLRAVRFAGPGDEGVAHGGAARVARSGRFFYLLPQDGRYAVPAPESGGRQAGRPATAARYARPAPAARPEPAAHPVLADPAPVAQAALAGDAVALPDGRLLAAVAAERPALSVAVRGNAGTGWPHPAALPLPDGAIGAAAPSLLRLRSGRLLLVFQALLPAGGRAAAATNCAEPARAEDPAAWSPPRVIAGPDADLQLANGRLTHGGAGLLLPFTCGAGAGVLASADDGAAWRRLGPLLPGPGAGLRYPAVAELAPGRLILLAATATHRIYRSISPDGGAAWSPPAEVTTLVAPEAPPALAPLPDGAGLLIAWNHHSRRDDGADRVRLSIAASTDGARWSAPRPLTQDPSQLAVRPSLASIPGEPGRFAATWVELAGAGRRAGVLRSALLTIPGRPWP